MTDLGERSPAEITGVTLHGAAVTVTEWEPGRAPAAAGPGQPPAGPGIISWIDIDVSDAEPRGEDERQRVATALRDLVGHRCAGQLEAHMVADLLGCRSRPDEYRYAGGRVRLFVAFEAETLELGGSGPGSAGAGPGLLSGGRMLICQPVGFLAGDGWVITCWHHRQGYQGAVRIPVNGTPKPYGGVRDAVAARWPHGRARTAGDLGVLIFNELALSYAPAHRRVYSWLESWELTLYLDADSGRTRRVVDRTTLPDLWGTMAVLRDWLSPQDRAGLHDDIDKAWFADCTDHDEVRSVDDRIDRALRELRELGTTLRSSFGLLHIQLAEEQQQRTERLGRMIEYVTAAVLIPALVVGFYGVNTRLPGGGTWWGFWVMVAAIIVLGAGAGLALRTLRSREAAGTADAAADRARARAGLARELTGEPG